MKLWLLDLWRVVCFAVHEARHRWMRVRSDRRAGPSISDAFIAIENAFAGRDPFERVPRTEALCALILDLIKNDPPAEQGRVMGIVLGDGWRERSFCVYCGAGLIDGVPYDTLGQELLQEQADACQGPWHVFHPVRIRT